MSTLSITKTISIDIVNITFPPVGFASNSRQDLQVFAQLTSVSHTATGPDQHMNEFLCSVGVMGKKEKIHSSNKSEKPMVS